MNWTDSVKKIREAQENNQLVIFVGAGVSKNSNIPTWRELIKKIAKKIGYSRCDYCEKKTSKCPKSKCKDRYAFTQDELLRIPEYYFQKDTSRGKSAYYKLIQKTLYCNKGPNPIDDEIFNILPHHIITTNYDSLLENSKVVNSQLYTVVCQDSDLLSKASDRYIIKMHGDLESPKTIVLKESDYIDYEQKHPLISTFIRSLLVNHTFVFLGYSLNDYNLNLIVGWINYFRKSYGVKERPLNFMVVSKAPSDFERSRLEGKNIFVVDLSSLPDNIVEKVSVPASFSNSIGKKMYSFLKCITDSQVLQNYVSLGEILAEKYQALKSYKKISYEDLIGVQPLGRTAFAGTELVFYDKGWYVNIGKLLDEGNQVVINTFQRAGLTAIHFFADNSKKDLPVLNDTNDKYLELYWDNRYVELLSCILSCSDIAQKIYYYRLLGKNDTDITKLIEEESVAVLPGDYVTILLHKMRSRIATISLLDRQKEKSKEIESLFETTLVRNLTSVGYLKMLFNSTAGNRFEMSELLEKQEERCKYRNNSIYMEHSFSHIWALQSYAYDYYFFFKNNGIPFDYFSDPKDYLCYYLRAILCSYSPVAPSQQDIEFNFATDHKHYPLNEVDIDMLIKYVNPKSLRSWLEKYSVQTLEIENGIDVVSKYKNLCDSFAHFKIKYWIDQILCFSIIVCLLQMTNDSKKDILAAMVYMFEDVTKNTPQAGEILFESVDYLIKHLAVEDADEIKGKLLHSVLAANVYPAIVETHRSMFSSVVKKLAPYANAETKRHLINEVETIEDKRIRINRIFLLRHVLQKDQYAEFLNSNIDLLNTEFIIHLLVEKVIPCNEAVINKYITTLIREDKKRKEQPGTRTFPDMLTSSIEEYLIIKLFGFDVDLAVLEPYAHYSQHLQFMLDPNNFDYSKVDTSNYMWQNLIYSQEYKKYFTTHKNELLSEGLKNLFAMGLETATQQKIVYGLLLDEDELRGFGK